MITFESVDTFKFYLTLLIRCLGHGASVLNLENCDEVCTILSPATTYRNLSPHRSRAERWLIRWLGRLHFFGKQSGLTVLTIFVVTSIGHIGVSYQSLQKSYRNPETPFYDIAPASLSSTKICDGRQKPKSSLVIMF